jgi:hypothetical protein
MVRKIGLLWIVIWFLMVSMTSCQLMAQDPMAITLFPTGNISYGTYETPRGQVTATYQRIGRFEFGQYGDGANSTSYQIGRFRYTDFTPPRDFRSSSPYYVPTYRRR